MTQIATTSHGTIIRHNGAEIGELGDITPPSVMRNEFDATSHNRDVDTWVMGVLRREAITFPVFYNKADVSHAALLTAIKDNTFDEYQVEFPDGSLWLGSGFCRQFAPSNAPVDGLLVATCTIRLSGAMYIDGVLFGE